MASDLEVISENPNMGAGNYAVALGTGEVLVPKKLIWRNGKETIEIPAGTIGYIQEEFEKCYLIHFSAYGFVFPVNKKKVMVGIVD